MTLKKQQRLSDSEIHVVMMNY